MYCRKCGAAVTGNYCCVCGERVRTPDQEAFNALRKARRRFIDDRGWRPNEKTHLAHLPERAWDLAEYFVGYSVDYEGYWNPRKSVHTFSRNHCPSEAPDMVTATAEYMYDLLCDKLRKENW